MSTGIPDIEATLLAENARLRARIEALEAEMWAAKTRQRQSETERLRTDSSTRVADETCHVAHAVAHAFVEQLRATADVISSVADEIWRRRDVRVEDIHDTAARARTWQDAESTRASRVADDLAAVVNTAIERSMDVPGRVINALSNSYRQS